MLSSLVLFLWFGPISLQYLAFIILAFLSTQSSFFLSYKKKFQLCIFLIVILKFCELISLKINTASWSNHLQKSGLLSQFWIIWALIILTAPVFRRFFETQKAQTVSFVIHVIGTMSFVTYAIFQHLTGFDVRRKHFKIQDIKIEGDNIYRIQLFTGHPNTISDIHSVITILFFCFFIKTKDLKEKKAWLLLSFFHFLFVFLSWTRFSLLLLMIFLSGLSLIYLKKNTKHLNFKKLLLALTLPGLLLLKFLKSGRIQELLTWISNPNLLLNIDKRPYFWLVHWNLFLEKPFWGHSPALIKNSTWLAQQYEKFGFGWIPEKTNYFMAHQIFLEILSQSGLIGLFFWTVLIGTIMQLMLQIEKGLFLGMLFLLIHGCIQNTLFDSSVMLATLGSLFWLMILNDKTTLTPKIHFHDLFFFQNMKKKKSL
jgi:hypothetical protein